EPVAGDVVGECLRLRAVRDELVEGFPVCVDEEDVRSRRPTFAQAAQHGRLEALDDESVGGPAGAVEFGGEEFVEGKPDGGEVGGVLELCDNGEGGVGEQLECVGEAKYGLRVAEAGAARPQPRQALASPQGAQLLPGEVFG